jgi:hypothetical protein
VGGCKKYTGTQIPQIGIWVVAKIRPEHSHSFNSLSCGWRAVSCRKRALPPQQKYNQVSQVTKTLLSMRISIQLDQFPS